jgi:xylulose-5-phosphate/fructose-6-phosphate phosphoketolase
MGPDETASNRLAARIYTREHGEDDPQIATWAWGASERSERSE